MTKPDTPGGNWVGGRGDGLHGLLGAYLLGGLEPAEAAAFAAHLAGCELCCGALAELEGLPGLLDAVPVPDAVALTAARPPVPTGTPEGQHVLEQLSRQRRRARRRVAGLVTAVAAASVAAGALVMALLAGPLSGAQQEPDESYSVSVAAGPQVRVDLVEKAWGTELSIDARSLPPEGTLSLWVVGEDGAAEQAGSWTAIAAGRARVTGATPLVADRIASVQIRDAAQQPVAVIPCGPAADAAGGAAGADGSTSAGR